MSSRRLQVALIGVIGIGATPAVAKAQEDEPVGSDRAFTAVEDSTGIPFQLEVRSAGGGPPRDITVTIRDVTGSEIEVRSEPAGEGLFVAALRPKARYELNVRAGGHLSR